VGCLYLYLCLFLCRKGGTLVRRARKSHGKRVWWSRKECDGQTGGLRVGGAYCKRCDTMRLFVLVEAKDHQARNLHAQSPAEPCKHAGPKVVAARGDSLDYTTLAILRHTSLSDTITRLTICLEQASS
jgi:hypothetical protein